MNHNSNQHSGDPTIISKTHIYFYGRSIYSNWHLCEFHNPTLKADFYSSEQAYMHAKARFFRDEEAAVKILSTKSPAEAKSLGRQVKNFNPKVWNEVALTYMIHCLFLKFGQNKELRNQLFSTEEKTFVECSPTDQIWGIGLGLTDPNIYDESKWRGRNLLGVALGVTRFELRAFEKNPHYWGKVWKKE